jgi:hypothetical protein
MSKRLRRLVTSDKHKFNHPCADIFTLACPVKEDDWLPGWRKMKNLIYSESGFAELGCVFTTKYMPHLMGSATWVINVYEPYEKIQYSAVNDKIVYQIQWTLKTLSNGCVVVVTRTWTAITIEAEEFLGRFEKSIGEKPPDLFSLIDHYLTTGTIANS